MRSLSLFHAYQSWRDNASERARARACITKILLRMQNLALDAAFSSWHTSTHEQQRTRTALAKIVRRMQFVTAATAFDRWAHEQQHGAALRQRTIARVLKAGMCGAFATWCDVVAAEVIVILFCRGSGGAMIFLLLLLLRCGA